jgi:drug/metabolite transporter (DMT)-like permease
MAQTVEPSAATPGGDWPEQAADTIERVVGSVRDKTSGPLTTVAQALVYGLLAAILGVAAAVLFAVGLERVLIDLLLEDDVWAAHLIVGGIFILAGMFLWSKRRAKPAKDER